MNIREYHGNEYENITKKNTNITVITKTAGSRKQYKCTGYKCTGNLTVLPDSLEVASGRSRVARFLAGQQAGCRVEGRDGWWAGASWERTFH